MSGPVPTWAARAVIGAIGVIACVAYLAGGQTGVGTAERDYRYSPADEPQLQLTLSADDVPFGHARTVSTMAAHASLGIARGRRTALRDFAAVTTATTLVLFAAWLHRANLPLFPVALAMMGMAASTTFWWRGVSWNGDALSPALAMIALFGVWQWLSTRRGSSLIVAMFAGAAAVVEDRAWVALLPGVGAVVWPRIAGVRRLYALAVLAALAALGVMAGHGSPLVGLTTLAGELVATVSREFTPLGAFLAVVGVAALAQSKATRLPALVTAASLVIWHVLTTRPPLESVSVPMAIAGWAAVAAALQWIHAMLPTRAGLAFITTIAIVLVASPALTRARLSALGRDLPSTIAARIAADLDPSEITGPATFVAESRRVDAAILLSSRQAGRDISLAPQAPGQILEAGRAGRLVFAFSAARTNLERIGFVFERAWIGNAAVGVLAGHLPCVDLMPGVWRDVSLIVARGSFVVHAMPPGVAPGTVSFRMTDRAPVAVRSIEPRSIPIEVAETAPDAGGLAELSDAAAPAAVHQTTTIRVTETGRIDPVVITLDAAPFAAVASAEGAPSRLCGGALRRPPTLALARTATAAVRMNEYDPFGPGWHPIEADPDFFRWTGAQDASVRLTVGRPGPVRITVTGTPAARAAQQPLIRLTVNQCRLAPQPMITGQGDYEWIAGADCWQSGVNQLWIQVLPLISPAALFATHDTRMLGARIGAIRFERTQ